MKLFSLSTFATLLFTVSANASTLFCQVTPQPNNPLANQLSTLETRLAVTVTAQSASFYEYMGPRDMTYHSTCPILPTGNGTISILCDEPQTGRGLIERTHTTIDTRTGYSTTTLYEIEKNKSTKIYSLPMICR